MLGAGCMSRPSRTPKYAAGSKDYPTEGISPMGDLENPTIAALDAANAALAHIRQEAGRIVETLPAVTPYARSLEIIIRKTELAQERLRDIRQLNRRVKE